MLPWFLYRFQPLKYNKKLRMVISQTTPALFSILHFHHRSTRFVKKNGKVDFRKTTLPFLNFVSFGTISTDY
jgi:hypothetical protein